MRRLLRLTGIAILMLFSLDFLIWLLDYFARWDFIKSIFERYPKLEWFVHTPYIYVALLAVGFATLYGQYKVRQPYILAWYINARLCPDLHSATLQAMFDTEQKRPGWDTKYKFDWNWFIELRLVNDSDTPTTVHEFEVKVKAGGSWLRRLIHNTRRIEPSLIDNMTEFQFYHRQGYKYDPKKEVRLPSLREKIKDKPLERGIGHDGWIGIHLKQANQREMNNKPTLYVWVVDAYGNKHPVHLRSRNDERKWDMWFDIVECA
jgi:hypothetical protein